MPYSAPAGSSVGFEFQTGSYAVPAADAVAFSFQPLSISGIVDFSIFAVLDGAGVAFELIDGWLDEVLTFSVSGEGYVYPYGDSDFQITVALGGIGEQSTMGDASISVELLVDGVGRVEAHGVADIQITPFVSAAAVYTPIITLPITVAATGKVAATGVGSVVIQPIVSAVGAVTRIGTGSIELALAATGVGRHGSGGAVDVPIEFIVVGTAAFHEPYSGSGAVALTLTFSARGETPIDYFVGGQIFSTQNTGVLYATG